ncbi:MAG TPA: LON peptidase substrate-binding domain-containing protein [Aliidongia sp.]|nr:LON peptidase substrate-binding domain-containing protein [Aliidongia sp.]
MSGGGPEFAARPLPGSLPVFPLPSVLLLPRGRLPLNIFEPRYLAMVDDALAGNRLVGMIQPTDPEPSGKAPALYKTGCVGRITSFAEDGPRYLITLTGVCRFDIADELATIRGYRMVMPDWTPYQADLVEQPSAGVDRARLLEGLKAFFKLSGITADWPSIETTPDERLVTSLAMICPFGTAEKQALLQAADLGERSRILTSLVEMAVLDHGSGRNDGARH